MKYIKYIDELTQEVTYKGAGQYYNGDPCLVKLKKTIYDGITWYQIWIDGYFHKTVRSLSIAKDYVNTQLAI